MAITGNFQPPPWWPRQISDPLYQACGSSPNVATVARLLNQIDETRPSESHTLSNALVCVCSVASSSVHLQIVKMLLAKGADANFKNTSGNAPIHAACEKIQLVDKKDSIPLQILQELINHSANPNLRHRWWKDTPLEYTHNPHAIKLLLEAKADPYLYHLSSSPWKREANPFWMSDNDLFSQEGPKALKQTAAVWEQYLNCQSEQTRILVECQVEATKTLFLRASLKELGEWKSGFAMTQLSDRLWEWRSTLPTAPFEFKVLLENQKWQVGPNLQMVHGKAARFQAQFDCKSIFPLVKSHFLHSRLTVVFESKPGQRLTIRGDGKGMNHWQANTIAVRQLDEKIWVIDLLESGEPFQFRKKIPSVEYKLFLEEEESPLGKWEIGDNHRIELGEMQVVEPQF